MADETGGGETGGDDTAADRMGTKETGVDQTPSVPPASIPSPASHSEASAMSQGGSAAAKEEETNSQPEAPPVIVSTVSLSASQLPIPSFASHSEASAVAQGDSAAAKEEEKNSQPEAPPVTVSTFPLWASQGDSRAAEEEEKNPQVTPSSLVPTLHSPPQSPLPVLPPVSLPESTSATHAHQVFEEIPDRVAVEVPPIRSAVEFPLIRPAVEAPVITPGEAKGLMNIVTMDVDKVCSLTQNVCSLKRASEEYIVELGSRAETMMGEMESMGVDRDVVQSEATRLLRSLNCFAGELRALRIRALLDQVILKVKGHCPNAVNNGEGIEEDLEQALLPQRDGPSPGGQWEEHVFLEPWEAKFWSVACPLAIVMIVTGIIFYFLP